MSRPIAYAVYRDGQDPKASVPLHTEYEAPVLPHVNDTLRLYDGAEHVVLRVVHVPWSVAEVYVFPVQPPNPPNAGAGESPTR